ncbi:sensor domain-containing diguanylate cyclase [Achromobacter deleyi]|uniref:GGDEF domain-containing protein n=1 Tax=Achromobacter deleyi TaxID=1353891 RepID=UPI0014920743|nr:sensor domain-containing diguanylate cyclase [Achromobacter deleyi]QVQ24708.1 GGDEF domain-containing protein [Achromobacter deleyi]UIP20244.1 sensor domain-containing diguanylate cyclase [Achromobacter deleyi]
MFRIDLRRLILWISLLSVFLVLAGGLHASYLVQRDLLLRNALEVNRVYASKLAVTTDSLLNDIRRYLSYSADMLADMETHPERMADETRRQEQQLGHFNSSFVASPQGKVLAVSSSYPQLLGQQLVSDAVNEALAARQPTISEPFQASNGRWQILYTQPIFSRDYRYLGFIAGSLYLHEDNVLDRLLDQHFYRDDSFLYVVDRKGTLIYHPDRSQLGKISPNHDTLTSARRGETGEMRYTDDHGRDMLAGYAPVPSTGWRIIAQRPVASTLRPLGDLLMATARNTLPLLLFSVALIWLLSRWIAQPLGEMADIAKHMQDPASADRIRHVRSWYFEAAQLKRALLIGLASTHHKLSDLRRETATDTLTGLLNRRGLDESLALLQTEAVSVAVVAIDIDHFKSINDRYGHAAGDQALQALANMMREGSRSGDTLARAGGEEFVMLLPGATMTAAIGIAQRLRKRLAAHEAPAPITISVGVAHYPEHGATLEAVFQRADQTLYYAKNHGRDAVCVADDSAKDGSRLVLPA